MIPPFVARLIHSTMERVRHHLPSASPRQTSASAPFGPLPLVLAPTVPWGIALFQRPQQLALAAASAGWQVVYTMPGETPRMVRPNLEISDDLEATLARFPRCVLMVFSTTPSLLSLERIEALRHRAIIAYDFIDEQHADIYAVDAAMRRRHDGLLRGADLVLVTADRLAEQVRAVRAPTRMTLCSPNAVDLTHFDLSTPPPRPEDMERFAARPVIGYYGALAKWVDYPLLDRLAVARPDCDLVLIGIDYDRSLSRSGILRRENVYFLGPRPYARLPAYLACFNVAIIPFVLNEVTESTSPIKLFEYMAGGRAIVTTDMRECRKYRSIAIGRTAEEFIAAVGRALESPPDAALLASEAFENSWARRLEDLARAVSTLSAEPPAGGATA